MFGILSVISTLANPMCGRAESVAWTAYNDCGWTADSGQNPSANDITGNFTTNSPQGLKSGPLMDSSGNGLSAHVTFDASAATGVSLVDRAFGPRAGTDADAWFASHIGTNCTASWTAGSVVMSLSNLNPSARYNIVLWSTRGADGMGYSNRFTDITLGGADLFTNKSSPGAELFTSSSANDKTRVRSALAPGLVARYDGVNPGSDGAVSVTITAGADMLWGPTWGTTNAYLNAFLVQEYPTNSGASDGTTTYAWRQGQVSGTMNASACMLYLYTSNTMAPVYIDDLCMCLGSTAESGANLIANPGFESGTNNWDVVGNFSGTSQPTSSHARNGSYSLLLDASSPVASGGSANSVKQNVTGLTSGAVHTLSFWYYATNAVDFVARYSAHPNMAVLTQLDSTGTGTNVPSVDGPQITGGQWMSASNTFQLSAATTAGTIYRVMRRDTLVGGSWQQLSLVTANVSTLTVNVPVTGQQAFYQLVETALGMPSVNNGSGASSVDTASAVLNGLVGSTGGLPTSVYVCWDTSDKGTASTGTWAHVDSLGLRGTGAFSDPVSSGLTAGSYYAYRCFAMNSAGSAFASTAAGFFTEPSSASGLGFPAVTDTTVTISWSTNGSGASGSLVVVQDGADPSVLPVDGTTYSANNTYGIGTALGGGYVVFSGAGTSVNVSGLSGSHTYYVRVYTCAGSGSFINYQQDSPATGSQKTADAQQVGPNAWVLIQGWCTDQKTGTVEPTYVYVANPVPGNHGPTISSVTATTNSVVPFGTVNLSVAATDADGDPLKYAWVVTGGQLGWSRAANETWTAPSLGGTYTIEVMVGDGKTWTNAFVNVTVNGNGTEGIGQHPVAVYSMFPSKLTVAPGETIQITATGSDRDAGDTFSVAAWNASDGVISGSGSAITWTAPSTPSNPASRVHYPGYAVWNRNRVMPAGCPFALSTNVVGIGILGRASTAQFSDTWMPSWGSDGNLYSPWQDGGLTTEPFSSMNWGWLNGGDTPAHNGWAQITGNDPQDLMLSKAGYINEDHTGWVGRYPDAMVHKDGVLYYCTRLSQNGGTMYPAGPNVGFSYSLDNGDNWTLSPYGPGNYLFGSSDLPTGPNGVTRLGQTYLVDYGQNQNHSPDGKVYFVSAGTPASDNNTHRCADDAVYLCRVSASVANINNGSAYEVWNGSGWTSTISAAQPIAMWTNYFSSVTITYNPGLNKYIMSAHRATYTGSDSSPTWGDYDAFFLEADSLTGPYRIITYLPAFGVQSYYLNIPTKFLSSDGRTAWLWYGANWSPLDRKSDPFGSGYRMTEQQIRFLTPSDLN